MESDTAGRTDNRPRTLHPSSLLFQILATARQSLLPVFIAVWTAVRGSWFAMIAVGGVVVFLLAVTLIRFLTFRYRIADGELVVTQGLVFRKVRNVPVDRIQNVDIVQNLFHRALGVAEVRVETASGTEPEATLRVLSMSEVEKLRGEIFAHRPESNRPQIQRSQTEQFQVEQTGEVTAGSSMQAENASVSEVVLRIPTLWLVKAGLASNRGMIMGGLALGLFFQQDWNLAIDEDFLGDILPQNLVADGFGVWLFVGLLAVLALVVVRLLGVVWYVLRFHDYRLERAGDDFHLTCGLLTRVSATVPRRRIQFISIHRAPIQRSLGIASIRIETAGGAGKQNEDASATVTRRWFVPVIPNRLVPVLIGNLRPGFEFHESDQPWQPFSPRAASRLSRLAIIGSLLIAAVGFAVWQPWGWIAGIVSLPLLWAITCLHLRFLGYARGEEAVVFRSGILNRKTSLTFYDKIQNVTLRESPFDRRWGMATVGIDTAASGPADHVIDVGLLEVANAKSELEKLSEHCAAAELVWR